MNETDLQLLERYAQQGAEDAFAEIVHRHLNLVYSAAIRQLRSPDLAEEAAQSVFTDLARQSHRLAEDTSLTAWLYQVTRYKSIAIIRRESRRQVREQIALELAEMNKPDADWSKIEPLLDEAMEGLDTLDKNAILLRYFESKSLREIGDSLGTSEDAARKRISRALDRLREFFVKRGIAITANNLADLIPTNAIPAAPARLAATLPAAAIAGKTLTMAGAAKGAAVVSEGATAGKLALFGSIAGWLVMLGGLVVTLKAQADETKSPRERKFVLQQMGLRLLCLPVMLGFFYLVQKLPHESLTHDIAFAGLLFGFLMTYFFYFNRYSCRQRQIQVEDGTWNDSEWTVAPRKSSLLSPPDENGKKRRRQALGLMGFGLACALLMVIDAPWKQAPAKAMMISTFLAGLFVFSYYRFQERPRFRAVGLGDLLLSSVLLCVLTLWAFNGHQIDLAKTGEASSMSLQILFNALVILAYVSFVALFRKRLQRNP